MLKLKNYLTENNQLSFMLLWFFLWLSIGTYPLKKNILYDYITLHESILLLRLYTPLFIFTVIVFLISLKKINFNFESKKWVFILVLIFVLQAIGLILNNERGFEPVSWIFILYSLIVCFVILNLKTINLKKIYFLNLFFIFIAFIIFIKPVYNSYFDLNANQLFMYNFSSWNEDTFGSPNVRVTGIARYCIIISIFLYAYLITSKNTKLYIMISCLFLIYFFILNIWMLQSRLIIGSLLILFCSSLFLKKVYGNFQLIGFFILICSFVFVSSLEIQNTKKKLLLAKLKNEIGSEYKISKKESDFKKNITNGKKSDILVDNTSTNESLIEEKISDSLNEEKIKKSEINKLIQEKNKVLEEKKISRFNNFTSSGRTKIWSELITSYDRSKIFGYGVQADRFLLVDPDRNLSTNASNAMLYVFVSGGYFAIIVFIILLSKSIILNFRIIRPIKKNINLNFFDVSAYMQINFFLIRQFFENSFAVFSVDLILFSTCFFYLIRRLEK